MNSKDNSIDRRTVLKIVGLSTASVILPGCSHGMLSKGAQALMTGGDRLINADGLDYSPIDRTLGDVTLTDFSGDNPTRFHNIIRNGVANFLQSKGLTDVPSPAETAPLVIVGGGMSGLTSAYLSRKYKPIILDRNDRLGGNAQGQSWRGIDYSIGAAYMTQPDADSLIAKFYSDVGVDKMWKLKAEGDPVEYKGKMYKNFWDGETAPGEEAQFKALKELFTDMYEGKNGKMYPEMPILTKDASKAKKLSKMIGELDKYNFKEYLEKYVQKKGLGKKLHPHIATAIEHYCWSSFGAPSAGISAAAGFSFYTAEFGPLCVMPGGNSAVAEQILKKLSQEIPARNFRPQSLVIQVSIKDNGVWVSYVDANDNVKTILAKTVVMACPKFIAKHIVRDLEPKRMEALNKLQYNGYLVANVLLNTPVSEPDYDIFMIGKGSDDEDLVKATADQGVTDIVIGTYARANEKNAVLTLYRALPTGAVGRSVLLASDSFQTYKTEFNKQVSEQILPLLKVPRESVVDVRLTRWGHALPQCLPGHFSKGVNRMVSAPLKNRVFFVEQDNWSLPAIETAISEAFIWQSDIEKSLAV